MDDPRPPPAQNIPVFGAWAATAVAALVQTRELVESRERRLVTWTLKARSACGEYDTRKLIDAWHDPAWTCENPEHPFAYIKTAFQNAALLAAQTSQLAPVALIRKGR